MPENKENLLVKEFIKGDESAFNKLVGLFQKKIYWHSRRMLGNHMDADEVTQEVLISMYKNLSKFNFNSSLSTWIFRITANKSVNQIRKRKVRQFLFLDDPDVREAADNKEIVNDIESREKLDKVDEILKKLPIKQREVFILRHFDGLKYDEISAITGKNIGTLKANYHHAIKKVMEKINGF
jgi:RNA polymerase sigma-70 factor (ECF subfamily)